MTPSVLKSDPMVTNLVQPGQQILCLWRLKEKGFLPANHGGIFDFNCTRPLIYQGN
jgi:hypothetical protein